MTTKFTELLSEHADYKTHKKIRSGRPERPNEYANAPRKAIPKTGASHSARPRNAVPTGRRGQSAKSGQSARRQRRFDGYDENGIDFE